MSTNHTIRLYREGEKRWHCSVRNCLNQGTHVCSHDRGTGSKTVLVEASRCREHAQKFRKKHDARYIKNEEPTDANC